jgi:phage terminase large subunit GpA-like protein
MSVPEWADTYRKLSRSAGAIGGAWRTSRVEIARGPMMAVTEPGVRTITLKTATQMLKSEMLLNTAGSWRTSILGRCCTCCPKTRR